LISPIEFEIGQTLSFIDNTNAVVRWIGSLPDREGLWLGLEVTRGGKHNGLYNGVQYFSCPPNCGIFRSVESVRASLEERKARNSERAEGEPSEVRVSIRENKQNDGLLNEWTAALCGVDNTLRLYPDTLEITHRKALCFCACDCFQAVTISRVDLEHVTSFVTFKEPYSPYYFLAGLVLSFALGEYLYLHGWFENQWEPFLLPLIFLIGYLFWVTCCRPFEMSIGVKGQNNPLFFVFSNRGNNVNREIEAAVRSQQRVLLDQRDQAKWQQRQGAIAIHI